MLIAVLGPLEVRTQDSVPVALVGAAERLLLAVLIAGAPGAVATGRLIESLWGPDPPESADEALRARIASLRCSLEPGLPRRSSGQYVLRRGSGYVLAVSRADVDTLRFADLAARGRDRLADGDPADAARLLATALGLWRGEPYADWPDAVFVDGERRRLTEIRAAAGAALVEARRRLGTPPAASARVAEDSAWLPRPAAAGPRAAVEPPPSAAEATPPRTPAAEHSAQPEESGRSEADGPSGSEQIAARPGGELGSGPGPHGMRRRRLGLAAKVAAALVVVLVAGVLAVRSQHEAARALAVQDGNRLADQATRESAVDLSLLQTAQGFRLADTTRTRDALLDALAQRGRMERAVSIDGVPQDAVLVGGGRTVTIGIGSKVVGWTVGAARPPRVILNIPDAWGAWRVAAPSPTEDTVMSAGEGYGVPWVRMVSGLDGTSRLLLQGDQVGGTPVEGAATADGRRFLLVVAEPDADSPRSASRWRLIDVDAVTGAKRDTGVDGVLPTSLSTLHADFADDAGSFILWSDVSASGLLVTVADGHRAPIPARKRPVPSTGFRALTSGAAQLYADGVVNLIDGTGAVFQQLGEHRAAVRDVVVAPDGSWGVTAGDGGAVVRWSIDPASGYWFAPEALAGHHAGVVSAEVDAAGRKLVTVSVDGALITWDMTDDGAFGTPYPGLEGRWIANVPEFVRPGGLLVAPTRPGRTSGVNRFDAPGADSLSVAATFLDAATGSVVDQVVVGDTVEALGSGSSVAVSPDGRMVAVTWGLGTTVLDTRTRKQIARIALPPSGDIGPSGQPLPATVVVSAGWSADGSRLLLGAVGRAEEATGGYLATVDTATWRVDGRIETGGGGLVIEPSPDGRLLAVGSAATAEVVILDAVSLRVRRRVPLAADDRIGALSFSPDGGMLAGGGLSGLLHVFDTGTWQPVGEPVAVSDDVLMQAVWLPDGRTVVTTGWPGLVFLVDVPTGTVRSRPLRASGEPGQGAAYLLPGPSTEIVVLAGDRAGHRYPLAPSAWLAEVCAIVARDLTRAEWNRYLPDQEYRPTCTDLP